MYTWGMKLAKLEEMDCIHFPDAAQQFVSQSGQFQARAAAGLEVAEARKMERSDAA
jgi:hypothetical protein